MDHFISLNRLPRIGPNGQIGEKGPQFRPYGSTNVLKPASVSIARLITSWFSVRWRLHSMPLRRRSVSRPTVPSGTAIRRLAY
jgi:hypothetical protein